MNYNRLKQRMCAFFLATTMPLTLSSCVKDKQENNVYIVEEFNEKTENVLENIKMSEEELNKYISFITSVNTVYNYDEFYITYEEVEKIIEISEKNYDCDYKFNGNIEELINKIKDNSNNFINQNKEYSSAFITHDYSDLENQNLFEFFLNQVLEELVNNATNDIEEDLCILSNLSIVFSYDKLHEDGLTYGAYNPYDNVLCIFPNDIDSGSKLKEIEYNILFEETIRHELNHVRQCCCPCKEKKGQKNIDINISTLIEASAESQIYNQNNDMYEIKESGTYKDERISESLILLLGLFHDDITINDYYNAIFNSNLKEFYDFCGVKTAEEIHKLYKILYAIDAHNLRHDFIFNFIDFSKKVTYKDIKETIGYDYKVDIFSKVLQNMIVYTYEHNDFKLEDNLVMLDIIKALIVSESCNYETDINGEIKRIYETDFSQNIYYLENKYIEFLSDYYNLEIEEIRTIENDIYSIASKLVNSYNFDIKIEDENIKSIINRFPLIEAIIKPNYIHIGEYDNFLNESGVTLIKKQ